MSITNSSLVIIFHTGKIEKYGFSKKKNQFFVKHVVTSGILSTKGPDSGRSLEYESYYTICRTSASFLAFSAFFLTIHLKFYLFSRNILVFWLYCRGHLEELLSHPSA